LLLPLFDGTTVDVSTVSSVPAGLLDGPLALRLALRLKRAQDMWVGARIAEAVCEVDVGGVLLPIGHPRELATAMVFVVIIDILGCLWLSSSKGRGDGRMPNNTRQYDDVYYVFTTSYGVIQHVQQPQRMLFSSCH